MVVVRNLLNTENLSEHYAITFNIQFFGLLYNYPYHSLRIPVDKMFQVEVAVVPGHPELVVGGDAELPVVDLAVAGVVLTLELHHLGWP